MSASDRVAWGEAQPVCAPPFPPQHGGWRWGVSEMAIDEPLAAQGRFALTAARGVMRDGTAFAFPADSPPPPALEIAGDAAGQSVSLVARPHWHIALGRDAGPDGLALARVGATPGWGAVFDRQHIPPLLAIAASPFLAAELAALTGRGERRAARLAEPHEDGEPALDERLEALVLARHLPVLRHLAVAPGVHPERLYEALAALAGELGTLAGVPAPAVAYAHDDLQATFGVLFAALGELLAEGPAVTALRLALDPAGPKAWISPIEDRSLYQYGRLYLSLDRAAAPADVPGALRLGAVEKMREIVAGRARGVPLRPVVTAPAALRGRAGRCLFELDRGAPGWGDFAFAAALGMQAMDSRGELDPELWCLTEEQS